MIAFRRNQFTWIIFNLIEMLTLHFFTNFLSERTISLLVVFTFITFIPITFFKFFIFKKLRLLRIRVMPRGMLLDIFFEH